MRTVFHYPPAIVLILLVAATTSSAQEHVGEQAWELTSSIDAIETEIQNLHAQHPTLVGAWSSPEGDGGPERLYLRLHDAATTLGKARIRVLLDLAPGDEEAETPVGGHHETSEQEGSSFRTRSSIRVAAARSRDGWEAHSG